MVQWIRERASALIYAATRQQPLHGVATTFVPAHLSDPDENRIDLYSRAIGHGAGRPGQLDADSESRTGGSPRAPDMADEPDPEELEDVLGNLLPVLGW